MQPDVWANVGTAPIAIPVTNAAVLTNKVFLMDFSYSDQSPTLGIMYENNVPKRRCVPTPGLLLLQL
jgi:hypothetical protein